MIRVFLFALVCLLGCDQLVEACHGGSSARSERRAERRSGAGGGCSGVAASASYMQASGGCSGASASVGYSRTTTVAHGTIPAPVVAAPAPTVVQTTVVPAAGPVQQVEVPPEWRAQRPISAQERNRRLFNAYNRRTR